MAYSDLYFEKIAPTAYSVESQSQGGKHGSKGEPY